MDNAQLVLAGLLAFVNNRVLEGFVDPLRKKFPEQFDKWSFAITYVSWVTGGVLIYLAGVNIFATYTQIPLEMGRVLTAITVGGGSGLLADIVNYLNVKKYAQ